MLELWLLVALIILIVAIYKPLTRTIFDAIDGHSTKVRAEPALDAGLIERLAVGQYPVPPPAERHVVLRLAHHGARPAVDAPFLVDHHSPVGLVGVRADLAVGT